jgi:putative spermidine/putrescine transport system ATP-binding protein
MLLDEPFSALDKNLRNQMQDEVRRLHRETGTTFVFVTHDQSEALALSSRVAIFDKGKLQQVADPEDIYERPANRFVAEFLGDINILPLSNVKTTASASEGQFEGGVLRATKEAGVATETLAVRPEYMRLSATQPKSGNAIAASIEELTYKGAETRLDLRSQSGTSLTLSMPTDALPEAITTGQQYWTHWPKEKGFFL